MADESTKFCINCGETLPGRAVFCSACGTGQTDGPAVAAPFWKRRQPVLLAVAVVAIIALVASVAITQNNATNKADTVTFDAPSGTEDYETEADQPSPTLAERTPATAAPQATAQPVKVTESAYTVVEGGSGDIYVMWVALYSNPNQLYGQFPTLTVTARDGSGGVLGTDDQVMNEIYPTETNAFTGQLRVTGRPASVEVTMSRVDWRPNPPAPITMTSKGVRIAPGSFGSGYTVTGEITNSGAAERSVATTVVLRGSNGKIVGADHGFVDDVPAGGSRPFDIDVRSSSGAATSAEVYLQRWS